MAPHGLHPRPAGGTALAWKPWPSPKSPSVTCENRVKEIIDAVRRTARRSLSAGSTVLSAASSPTRRGVQWVTATSGVATYPTDLAKEDRAHPWRRQPAPHRPEGRGARHSAQARQARPLCTDVQRRSPPAGIREGVLRPHDGTPL